MRQAKTLTLTRSYCDTTPTPSPHPQCRTHCLSLARPKPHSTSTSPHSGIDARCGLARRARSDCTACAAALPFHLAASNSSLRRLFSFHLSHQPVLLSHLPSSRMLGRSHPVTRGESAEVPQDAATPLPYPTPCPHPGRGPSSPRSSGRATLASSLPSTTFDVDARRQR